MTAQRAAQHDSTARGSENSRRASAICILSPEFRCFNNVIRFVNPQNTHIPASGARSLREFRCFYNVIHFVIPENTPLPRKVRGLDP